MLSQPQEIDSSINQVVLAVQNYLNHYIEESAEGHRVRKHRISDVSLNLLFDPTDRINFHADI